MPCKLVCANIARVYISKFLISLGEEQGIHFSSKPRGVSACPQREVGRLECEVVARVDRSLQRDNRVSYIYI